MMLSGKEFIPVVEAALSRKQPVRMTVRGNSMVPFIHNGEAVELEPFSGRTRLGDILLARHREGDYIMHRVVRNGSRGVFLRGDARWNFECEGPLAESDIVGNAVRSWHRGRIREHRRGIWRAAGIFWSLTCPVGIALYRMLRFAKTSVRPEHPEDETPGTKV